MGKARQLGIVLARVKVKLRRQRLLAWNMPVRPLHDAPDPLHDHGQKPAAATCALGFPQLDASRLAGSPQRTDKSGRQRNRGERSSISPANRPRHHVLTVDPESQLGRKARPAALHGSPVDQTPGHPTGYGQGNARAPEGGIHVRQFSRPQQNRLLVRTRSLPLSNLPVIEDAPRQPGPLRLTGRSVPTSAGSVVARIRPSRCVLRRCRCSRSGQLGCLTATVLPRWSVSASSG